MELPEPTLSSNVSLERTLASRRSIRSYAKGSLALHEVSQLMWSAQGITSSRGFRTAPSAGALYPLELYMVAGEVENLDRGVYRYQSGTHSLVRVKQEDMRRKVSDAALRQGFVEQGAVVFVLSAIYERTTGKYGQRGVRYVHMEAGHAAQNLLLQATALGLGAVPVGAFHDDELAQVLGLAENEHPLYVIPVGPGD